VVGKGSAEECDAVTSDTPYNTIFEDSNSACLKLDANGPLFDRWGVDSFGSFPTFDVGGGMWVCDSVLRVTRAVEAGL
jgi:hypothetical protein